MQRFGAPILLIIVVGVACTAAPDSVEEEGTSAALEGEAVSAPFAVKDDSVRLLFTYADDDGPKTATSVSGVPADRRELVRVQPLAPDQELDPERVYVVDLREVGEGGRYPIRIVDREVFEAHVERASARAAPPPNTAAPAGGSADVVLYGTSWCGACRQARQYLRERGVDFVDRDIEREPGAREEMTQKARAAGVQARGVPFIDFRGTMLTGFSRESIDRLLASGR